MRLPGQSFPLLIVHAGSSATGRIEGSAIQRHQKSIQCELVTRSRMFSELFTVKIRYAAAPVTRSARQDRGIF